MSGRMFVILALVAVTSKVQANAVLRGVVLLNEEGGSPMGNVEVDAIGGNPNNTGVDGQFKFKFPNKNPGDTVRLSPHKEGYRVVNWVQLDVTLPSNPDERPLLIYICREGDYDEMARRFHKLKFVGAIDEKFKREAQNASPAEVAKLREKRDQAKEATEKPAEEFAKQKPGAGSELYQTAMRLFLDGNADEALSALNPEKLREFSKAAKEDEKAANEAVENWLLRAQLLTVEFRFGDAEKAYQEAIEALKIFRELAGTKPDTYLPYIAMTLNNLAILDRSQNRMERARREFEDALAIYERLAARDPDRFQSDVAQVKQQLQTLNR
jgi:hypothetical protein